MKTFSLSVFVVFLMQIIMSCASSQETVSYSYEKIDERRQDANTEVWTYRYSLADGPWEEIKVYVRNQKMTYKINVGTYFGHQENSYVYNSLKQPQNFISQSRIEPGTVNSLNEAVEMALSWFIEDNKTRKQ